MKKVFSLLLALMLVFSLALPAFAVSSDDPGTVNVGVNKTKEIWVTRDLNALTKTDLFGNFKNVMPGDTLKEIIEIRNFALQYDYIKVYLQAKPHSAGNAPQTSVSVADNYDFLSKLELKVISGDDVVYHAKPGGTYELDEAGSLKEPVYLGKLKASNSIKTMDLVVELKVPAELDNQYSNAMGEVDWVFYFEGFMYPSDIPQTGDYIMMAVAIMAVSGIALAVILAVKRKKKK